MAAIGPVCVLLLGLLGGASAWEELADGPWSAREGLMAVSTGEFMLLSGGRTTGGVGFAADVWRSDNGTRWTQLHSNAFPKRAYHSMVYLKGCVYVMGGQTFQSYLNDVYRSCDGGQEWQPLGNASWSVRAGQAAAVHNGQIVVAGGCYGVGPLRFFRGDVWTSPDGVSWTQLTSKPGWSGTP
jgi:hypothetical protein